MATISDIHDNLVLLFENITQLPVIWEYQDAPKPSLPYVSLSFTTPASPLSQFVEVKYSHDDYYLIKLPVSMFLSVKLLSQTREYTKAFILWEKMFSEEVYEFLRRCELSLSSVSQLRDLSFDFAEDFINRYQFDVLLYTYLSFKDKIYYINKVQLNEGEFYKVDNSLIEKVNKIIEGV